MEPGTLVTQYGTRNSRYTIWNQQLTELSLHIMDLAREKHKVVVTWLDAPQRKAFGSILVDADQNWFLTNFSVKSLWNLIANLFAMHQYLVAITVVIIHTNGFTQGYTVRHWLSPRDIPYVTGLHPGIYRTSLAYTQGYTVRHWLTPRDILYVTSGWSTDRFLSRHSSQRPFVKLFMNWRWIKIVRLYTMSTLDWNKIFVQFLSKLFRFQTAIFTATHPKTRGNFWWLFRDSLDILSCLDLRSIIVQRTSMKIFHVDNVDRWWTLPIWIQHTGAVTITTTKFSKTSADFEIVDSMIWAPQQNSHRHFHFSQPVNVTVRTLYHSQSMIWSLG